MTNEKSDTSTKSTEWMIKTCDEYKQEYKDCKKFRSRFNQYFDNGEFLDCTQWKEDHNNCNLWEKKKDIEAYDALVKSERTRRLQRLGPHFKNDVWTKRENPPADWNKPLPEWMEKQHENSYLQLKQKALLAEVDK